jgi:hypothetical protein
MTEFEYRLGDRVTVTVVENESWKIYRGETGTVTRVFDVEGHGEKLAIDFDRSTLWPLETFARKPGTMLPLVERADGGLLDEFEIPDTARNRENLVALIRRHGWKPGAVEAAAKVMDRVHSVRWVAGRHRGLR